MRRHVHSPMFGFQNRCTVRFPDNVTQVTLRGRGNPYDGITRSDPALDVREITMLMNRSFFLPCAAVVMLGIAAAGSAPAYARHCSDLDSDRDRTICYVRSAIYRAEAAASETKAKYEARHEAKRARDGSATRLPDVSKTTKSTTSTAETKSNTASSPATCGLTKEYDNGTLTFRDTCTGEWAQREREAGSATRPPDVSRTAKSTTPGDAKAACGLTKEYVDGALTFRDTCTEHNADAAPSSAPREAEHNADAAPSLIPFMQGWPSYRY